MIAMSSRVGWKVPYGVYPEELPITERYFAGGSTTLARLRT